MLKNNQSSHLNSLTVRRNIISFLFVFVFVFVCVCVCVCVCARAFCNVWECVCVGVLTIVWLFW